MSGPRAWAWRAVLAMLALCLMGTAYPALAQTDDPAPYLHAHTTKTGPARTDSTTSGGARRGGAGAHESPGTSARAKKSSGKTAKTKTSAAKKPAAHRKPAAKPRSVPVVAPLHALPPRRPAHEATRVVTPPVPPAIPAKPAPPPPPANIGTNTGLPLPRYAALKSDDVNMRSGPGERYPVLWTYQRRDLPVRIEREFDIWRLVEDMDGVKGWIQAAFLAGHRSFVIAGASPITLRDAAQDTGAPVAVLKPGVVGRIRACDAGKDWCEVQVQDYHGWLKRDDFWGSDPAEAITP